MIVVMCFVIVSEVVSNTSDQDDGERKGKEEGD